MDQYTGCFRGKETTSKRTCSQCRARKIRCDGGPTICAHCESLGESCSLSGSQDTIQPNLSRRRVSRACQACRGQKIRCSGTSPQCSNCQRRSIDCHYSNSRRKYRPTLHIGAEESPGAPVLSRAQTSEEQTYSHTAETVTLSVVTGPSVDNTDNHIEQSSVGPNNPNLITSGPDLDLGEAQPMRKESHTDCTCYPYSLQSSPPSNNSVIPETSFFTSNAIDLQPYTPLLLESIDDFFALEYPLPAYSFLHPATTRTRCLAGQLEKPLAYAIYGLTSIHAAARRGKQSSSHIKACTCRGLSWIQAAEMSVWQSLERPTISRLQALLLIINYWMETGRFQRAFMLSSLAARSAAAMRLNHERTDIDLVFREVRRRITWSLKLIDRYFSIGLAEFELCPFEVIYLQLPGAERDFSAGLDNQSWDDGGAYNIWIRLESLRRDIMKMNRGVALCDEPYLELPRLIHEFERDLSAIGSRMPQGPGFSADKINGALDSLWISRRVAMHLSWHQCHCDIYRLFLSGFSEAAPRPVLTAFTSHFLETAETKCLHHAYSIVNILTHLNQLSTRPHLLEFDTAICAYQASRLILFISRFGKTSDSPETEFATSRVDLCLAALNRFFPDSVLVKPIIQEIERTLKTFLSSSVDFDATNNMTERSSQTAADNESRDNAPKSLSSMEKLRERLAVHSLLRRADFSDGQEVYNTISPSTPSNNGMSVEFTSDQTPQSTYTHDPRTGPGTINLSKDMAPRNTSVGASPADISESTLASVLLGLRNGTYQQEPRETPEQNPLIENLKSWEFDSMVQEQGWDGPLFPWYGLQDQDWSGRLHDTLPYTSDTCPF